MSVSKWAYEPKVCDGDICIGECDLCKKADEALTAREESEDEE